MWIKSGKNRCSYAKKYSDKNEIYMKKNTAGIGINIGELVALKADRKKSIKP